MRYEKCKSTLTRRSGEVGGYIFMCEFIYPRRTLYLLIKNSLRACVPGGLGLGVLGPLGTWRLGALGLGTLGFEALGLGALGL